MFWKPFDKQKIKKVLLISLTNIGDVILTFPVLDILKETFPLAELSVIIGPKAASLLKDNPHLKQVHIFDKRNTSFQTALWIWKLREEHFDLVIDLRNSAIPFMIAPRYRTSARVIKKESEHMKDKHIRRLRSVYPFPEKSAQQYAFAISLLDQEKVTQIKQKEIGAGKFVVLAPGAADQSKRWTEEGFAQVADHIATAYRVPVVLVGDKHDQAIAQRILKLTRQPAINLCGRLSLPQLGGLFPGCHLAIVNDSAPMHLASYLNIPILAIFGPTDPQKYGPWSTRSRFLRNNTQCLKCQDTKLNTPHTCITAITPRHLLESFEIKDNQIIFRQDQQEQKI